MSFGVHTNKSCSATCYLALILVLPLVIWC